MKSNEKNEREREWSPPYSSTYSFRETPGFRLRLFFAAPGVGSKMFVKLRHSLVGESSWGGTESRSSGVRPGLGRPRSTECCWMSSCFPLTQPPSLVGRGRIHGAEKAFFSGSLPLLPLCAARLRLPLSRCPSGWRSLDVGLCSASEPWPWPWRSASPSSLSSPLLFGLGTFVVRGFGGSFELARLETRAAPELSGAG